MPTGPKPRLATKATITVNVATQARMERYTCRCLRNAKVLVKRRRRYPVVTLRARDRAPVVLVQAREAVWRTRRQADPSQLLGPVYSLRRVER